MDYVELTKPFSIIDFSGGMRRNCDPSALGDNEYVELRNGRTRYGPLETIKLPKDISDNLPLNGNAQGIYAAGSQLFCFIDGRAFFKDLLDDTSIFLPLSAFGLDANANTIYAELIPASTINQARVSSSSLDSTSPITFANPINQTPSAILCQDGKSQPFIIISPTQARQVQTLDQWSNADNGIREYVPVGKQMLYYDAILYIISPKGDEIYRSVSGRPLDFVIAIDNNGNKLDDPPNGIEAGRLSHKVDYDEITVIRDVTITESLANRLPRDVVSAFLVCTKKQSYLVAPNYSVLYYGEPLFNNRPIFPTGALNQFCVLDLLGGTALIDATGLKSVEEILSSQNEGEQLPFASALDIFFKGIFQDDCCCINHNNFAYFFVKTIYGYRAIIFDVLKNCFTSIDDYTNIQGHIKYATETIVNNRRRLFVITTTCNVYEIEAGEETAKLDFFSKEWIDPENHNEMKPMQIDALIQNAKEDGILYATEIVDRKLGAKKSEVFSEGLVTGIDPDNPFGVITDNSDVEGINFGMVNSDVGHKIAFKLSVDTDCAITLASILCTMRLDKIDTEQMGKSYK